MNALLDTIGRLSVTGHRLILLSGCVVLFFLWLRPMPLTEIDETRFSEATRAMVASGNYLVPQFNGAPRYQKPILYYWIQSVPVRLFGANEVAARLPSAIASLLLVLLVHAFLLRWLARREDDPPARAVAFLGAAALATMPLLAIWSRAAVTDPTLTLFITLALLALLHADLLAASPDPGPVGPARYYLLATAAMGLAFLTKGPIGLAVPGLIWLAYHLCGGTLRAAARRVPWLGAIGVFLLVAAPWYIAVTLVDGPGFLAHFFMEENVQRFAGSAMEGHGMGNRLLGLITYWPLALLFLAPYSAFLVADVLAPGDAAPAPWRCIRRFAWCWLVVVIGLFSLSKTQLPHYIQCIAPAAALLFALYLSRRSLVVSGRYRAWAHGVTVTLLIVLIVAWVGGMVAAVLTGGLKGQLDTWLLPEGTARTMMAVCIALGGAGVLAIALHAQPPRWAGLVGWTMTLWAICLGLLLLWVAPAMVHNAYGPTAAVGRFLRAVPGDEPILAYGRQTAESLVYYARRPIVLGTWKRPERFAETLRAALATHPSVVIVTDVHGLSTLDPALRRVWLYRDGSVVVVRAVKGTP